MVTPPRYDRATEQGLGEVKTEEKRRRTVREVVQIREEKRAKKPRILSPESGKKQKQLSKTQITLSKY
jgi:hypothetical protein